MLVTPPGLSPQQRGLPKTSDDAIEVIDVHLDPQGRAFDHLTGQYLKWIQTNDDYGELFLGIDEGIYLSLRIDGDKIRLCAW